MAYNGGATTGSIDIIQRTPPQWNDADLGLLAAMDKVGMTIGSPIWGYFLQFCEPKLLLICGLATNAAATLAFGSFTSHSIMLFAKLLIGFTEGLQWVWSQTWVVKHAGGYPLFLNMNMISAGVGMVLGIAVSGVSIAHGYSYGFAFQVAGFCLIAFWCCLLFVRGGGVALYRQQISAPGSPVRRMPVKDVLKMLMNRPIYYYTAAAFAFCMWLQTGCQFVWTRVFIDVWQVSRDHATLGLLVAPIIGSCLGYTFGSGWQFNTREATASTLRKCASAALVTVIGAFLVLIGMFIRMQEELLQISWPFSLTLTYIGFILVFAGDVACMGALVGICTDCIEDKSIRGLCVGLQQAVSNCFGLALSPLLPQLVMFLAHRAFNIPDHHEPPIIIFCGTVTTLCATCVNFFCCCRAAVHSRKHADAQIEIGLHPGEICITGQSGDSFAGA